MVDFALDRQTTLILDRLLVALKFIEELGTGDLVVGEDEDHFILVALSEHVSESDDHQRLSETRGDVDDEIFLLSFDEEERSLNHRPLPIVTREAHLFLEVGEHL